MSILKTIVPKSDRILPVQLRRRTPEDPRQRGLMVGSLCLLLVALSIVLWKDRDFWFPDSSDADIEEPVESSPVAKAAPAKASTAISKPAPIAKSRHKRLRTSPKVEAANITAPDLQIPPPIVMTSRTVLPPLEVEVVAGDTHRVIRPGSNSLHVDLEPGIPPEPAVDADTVAGDNEPAANITSPAAERVQMSAGAADIVVTPVKPNYPLLARQMRVQGSVILQALIGKDGIIQNLRVVSGPRILAAAAEDAVRQWHFKPHFEGSEAVETQAKITVNFTISTN
jgi:TonB family protein